MSHKCNVINWIDYLLSYKEEDNLVLLPPWNTFWPSTGKQKIVANAEAYYFFFKYFRSMPDVSARLSFKTIFNGTQTLGNEWMPLSWPAKSFNYWALTTKKICRYHRKHEDMIIALDTALLFLRYPSMRPRTMTYFVQILTDNCNSKTS